MKTRVNIVLPDFNDGEAGDLDAVVSLWIADEGTFVAEGDDLLEIITDKASFVVPCPRSGVLVEKCVHEDEHVRVNDVIGVLEVESD